MLLGDDQPLTETSTSQHTTLTRQRHPCKSLVGLKAKIPAGEQLQTHAFDHWGQECTKLVAQNVNVICSKGTQQEASLLH